MNKLLVLMFLIVAIFSGCSIKDVSKPIVKYTIYDNSKTIKKLASVDKVLKISTLKSPKYMQSHNIWYKTAFYETNSYLYSTWNENFVSLIEQNIASSIYDSNLFKNMFTHYSKVKSDLLLEGEIVDARQIIHSERNAVVSFKIRFYLIDSRDAKIIGSDEFEYSQKCSSIDAKGAILAYNEIVNNLNKDVVLWLKKLVKEN